MSRVLLALGSNDGDRESLLQSACNLLDSTFGVELIAHSSLVETRPIGGRPGQGNFLNMAAVVEARVTAQKLLDGCQRIERQLGRQPSERWDQRTIDIDIILFGDERIETAGLAVPHPRFAFRRFVLEPACEVAAEMRDPRTGLTVAELMARLDRTPRIVVIAGAPAAAEIVRLVTENSDVLSDEAGAAETRLLDSWPEEVVSPTLVVAVRRMGAGEGPDEVVRRAIAARVPSIVVDEQHLDWAVTEISAALVAMRP